MRDRLIELIDEFDELDFLVPPDWWIEHLADYLLANGVIVPPCKVGDKVYQTDGVRIYESTINEIDIFQRSKIFCTEKVVFDEDAIGTSIFLTPDAMEKALAERSRQ